MNNFNIYCSKRKNSYRHLKNTLNALYYDLSFVHELNVVAGLVILDMLCLKVVKCLLAMDRLGILVSNATVGLKTGYNTYMNDEISKDEFLKEYRNPNNYQPENVHNNRSHKYEKK